MTEYALVLFIVSIAVVALITAIGAIADGQLGNLTSLLNSLTP